MSRIWDPDDKGTKVLRNKCNKQVSIMRAPLGTRHPKEFHAAYTAL